MNPSTIKFFGHRIQAGKAIIDVKIHDGSLPVATWIGDAYELRKQLNECIQRLEEKNMKKRGRIEDASKSND